MAFKLRSQTPYGQSCFNTDQQDSPLHKQRLSPKAAKAKAKRDLAYAETPDRRRASRRRRRSPG